MNDYYIPANLMPMKNDIIEEEIKSIDIDLSKMYDRETDSHYPMHDDKVEIRTDVFSTGQEAQQRAEEIGCNGIHTHSENGETIYMPCASHDEYERIIGKELKPGDHDMEEKKINSFSVSSFDKQVNKK